MHAILACLLLLFMGHAFADQSFVDSVKAGKVYEVRSSIIVTFAFPVKNNTEPVGSPFSLRVAGRSVEAYDRECKLDPKSEIRITEVKGNHFVAEILSVGPMYPDFKLRNKLCEKGVHAERSDGEKVFIIFSKVEMGEYFKNNIISFKREQ